MIQSVNVSFRNAGECRTCGLENKVSENNHNVSMNISKMSISMTVVMMKLFFKLFETVSNTCFYEISS